MYKVCWSTSASVPAKPKVSSRAPSPSTCSTLTATRWQVTNHLGSERLFLNTSNYQNLSGSRLGELALVKNREWERGPDPDGGGFEVIFRDEDSK